MPRSPLRVVAAGEGRCDPGRRRPRAAAAAGVVAVAVFGWASPVGGVGSGTGSALGAGGFDGFNDKIAFGIVYSTTTPDFDLGTHMSTPVSVTTPDKEDYACYLPKAPPSNDELNGADKDEAEPSVLIRKLKDKCLRRLDVYWSYELCVDQHMRQYHEDVETDTKGEKKSKVTEHFLGRSKKILQVRGDDAGLGTAAAAGAPSFTYNGKVTPYHSESYVGGDICDLTKMPRSTEVRYICDPETMHMMGSYQETSTCNYLVVVHTNLLCAHSEFTKESTVPHQITCVPAQKKENAKPVALQRLEAAREAEREQMKAKLAEEERVRKKQQAKRGNRVVSPNERKDLRTVDLGAAGRPPAGAGAGAGGSAAAKASAAVSVEIFKELLRKGGCLAGGTGWWQVEFCYGKFVRQVHRNSDGTKDVVMLGSFEPLHQSKLYAAAQKGRTKADREPLVAHYYKDGDLCEDTQRNRKAKVRFLCDRQAKSASTVTIALEETKTCEYVLKVRSPMLCPMVEKVDKNGLFDLTATPFVEKVVTNEKSTAKAPGTDADVGATAPGSAAKTGRTRGGITEGGIAMPDYTAEGARPSPNSATENAAKAAKRKQPEQEQPTKGAVAATATTMKKFLKGQHCFKGGKGWWTFEVCYKKHVHQIHTNDDGTKQIVKLGVWDEAHHTEVNAQRNSKSLTAKTQVLQYYRGGDYCEEVKRNRKVTVKMTCSKTLKGSQVSLRLTEGKTCEYVMHVEAAFFCALVDNLGPDGLFVAP